MSPLPNAFWRAAAYLLHRRVILLPLAPLLLAGGLALALGYFFWEPAGAGVRATLESWSLLAALQRQREQAAVPAPQPVPFTPLLPALPPALP